MSFSEVIGCLDFFYLNLQYHWQEKTQMGSHRLTRPVYKNTFSDSLLVDSSLNEEEQHYNNS